MQEGVQKVHFYTLPFISTKPELLQARALLCPKTFCIFRSVKKQNANRNIYTFFPLKYYC